MTRKNHVMKKHQEKSIEEGEKDKTPNKQKSMEDGYASYIFRRREAKLG